MTSAPEVDAVELARAFASAVLERELNLRKVFGRYDEDGNGVLDRGEFSKAMAACGLNMDGVDELFPVFDAGGTGVITPAEFMGVVLEHGEGAKPDRGQEAEGQVSTTTTKAEKKGSAVEKKAPRKGSLSGSSTTKGQHNPTTGKKAKEHSKAARHAEVIEEAQYVTEVDGETMTDAEVMDELSNRLEEEGVPLHKLFKVLCPGKMNAAGLRDVLKKMGLGYALSENPRDDMKLPLSDDEAIDFDDDERLEKKKKKNVLLQGNVGHGMECVRGFSDGERRAESVLTSGETSDEALLSLLPLLKSKLHAHGYDTGKVGTLFLDLDIDRDGYIAPEEFFVKLNEWGVRLTPEQTVRLLDPFDLDRDGRLDFNEFAKWVAMWLPPDDGDFDSSWRRGGPTDRRVWAASGAGSGRKGRLARLMRMIDADHNGVIESFEFVRALARGDDYDRPIGGQGGQGGKLGGGRLNPDGSLKATTENKAVPFEEPPVLQEPTVLQERPPPTEKRQDPPPPETIQDKTPLPEQTKAQPPETHSEPTAEERRLESKFLEKLASACGASAENRTALSSLVAANRPLSGADLDAFATSVGVEDPTAAMSLVARHGHNGRLPAWKLLQLLSEYDVGPPPELVEKKPQPRIRRPSQEDLDAAEEAALVAAAKAARARPQQREMTPAQLKAVQLNDNAMIQQLRAELAERSKTMKSMFVRCDTNGDGEISVLEFRKALQRSGFHDRGALHLKGLDRDVLHVSVQDTVRIFNYFDLDGDGRLSYSEFMRLLQNSIFVDYTPFLAGENQHVTGSGVSGGEVHLQSSQVNILLPPGAQHDHGAAPPAE